MACQVILEVRTKEGCFDQVRDWFKGALPDTREYDGCQSIHLVNNQDDPNSIMIVEQWETRQKYETYLAWRGERGDMDTLGAMLDGEPSIRFFDYMGI
jgi:quinol monooxygenase YgiN